MTVLKKIVRILGNGEITVRRMSSHSTPTVSLLTYECFFISVYLIVTGKEQ